MTGNTEWTCGRGLALPCDYEVHELSNGVSAVVYDANGLAIDTHLTAEQAAQIVRAVNSLPALVKALEEAKDALEGLSNIHDGNPSDAMADTPPLEYARHMLYEARQIAREAASEARAALASHKTED